MRPQLVGDRFLGGPGSRWRDVATGRIACLRLHALGYEDWPSIERRLAPALLAPGTGSCLVDFGLASREMWFEAFGHVAPAGSRARALAAAHDVAARLASAASRSHRGARVVSVPARPGGALLAASVAARDLRTLGYVAVRAGVALPAPLVHQLSHRHLAVLVCDERDRHAAAWWIQRVASVSPRGHLIADLAPRPPGARAVVLVHERAAEEHPWTVPVRTFVPGEAPAAIAEEQPARWGALRRAAGQLLAADLTAAESTLAELTSLGELDGLAPAATIRFAQAEVRFWQGRFEEAASLCSGDDGDEMGAAATGFLPPAVLRGLLAWATGDVAGISCAGAVLDRRPGTDERRWRAALDALAASLEGDAARVAAGVRQATCASAPARHPRLSPLLRAVLIEACAPAGAGPRLKQWRPVQAARRRLAPLYQLLFDWIGRPGDPAPPDLSARINRAGAHGVRRWGTRTMHLLHALPAMLQLVHDAEDELAALSGSCAWLRRHSAADGAAFLASDGQVVAGDEWVAAVDAPVLAEVLRAPEPREIRLAEGRLGAAPVRYAGRTMGAAVVRGPGDLGATLCQAAATLAALGAPALRARLDVLALARDSRSAAPEIVGRSAVMDAARDALVRAAAAPFPVVLEGESGTGKELAARALHRLSPRRDRRFSAVNCAALGDDLIEAELFGHARGAFTGALGSRAGLFEDAHGGTLMLDEVSELSARAQAKLLRVLQEREVRRLGENAPRPIDVRLVAATNRPLADLAGRGLFREDLLFRLAVIRLRLPPLRERLEDVPELALAFWRDLARQAGKHAVLAADAIAALCRHGWPGNVRELQNVVAALVVDAPVRGRVGARAVARVLSAAAGEVPVAAVSLESARLACERHTIATALARHGGRRAAAARELGLTRQGLAKAIRRLGLGASASRSGGRAGVA